MIKAEDYKWYEVRVVRHDSRTDFLCRLIATSKCDAIRKIDKWNVTIAGSTLLGKALVKRYISRIEAEVVSDKKLSLIDLNNTNDVEMFRTQEHIVLVA